jgi:hypothetical protein
MKRWILNVHGGRPTGRPDGIYPFYGREKGWSENLNRVPLKISGTDWRGI